MKVRLLNRHCQVTDLAHNPHETQSRAIYVLILTILISFTQCRDFSITEKEYAISLHNNSGHNIRIYINDNSSYKAVYPDTLITNFSSRLGQSILPGHKYVIAASSNWEDSFQINVPNDTVSIFVFDADTLSLYGWDNVRSQYKIMERYDVSLSDLTHRNFILEFPYDGSKGVISVWSE